MLLLRGELGQGCGEVTGERNPRGKVYLCIEELYRGSQDHLAWEFRRSDESRVDSLEHGYGPVRKATFPPHASQVDGTNLPIGNFGGLNVHGRWMAVAQTNTEN